MEETRRRAKTVRKKRKHQRQIPDGLASKGVLLAKSTFTEARVQSQHFFEIPIGTGACQDHL